MLSKGYYIVNLRLYVCGRKMVGFVSNMMTANFKKTKQQS